MKKKFIGNIGASVYHLREAAQVVKDNKFDVIQIPFNILDQRFNNKKFIKSLALRKKNLGIC